MRRSLLGFISAALLLGTLFSGCQQPANQMAETTPDPAPPVASDTPSTPHRESEKALKLLSISEPLPNGTVEEGLPLGSEVGQFGEGGSTFQLPKPVLEELEANHESITNFSLPQYNSVFFLSTSSDYSVSPADSVNRIYIYNEKEGGLTLLYEEKQEHMLRLIGRDGSKLIIFVDFFDNSPGPCAITWLMNNSTTPVLALELADISAGFQSYTIPLSQIEKAKKEEMECRKEAGLPLEVEAIGPGFIKYFGMMNDHHRLTNPENIKEFQDFIQVHEIKTTCPENAEGPCGFSILIMAPKNWEEAGQKSFYLARPSATGGKEYWGLFMDDLSIVLKDAQTTKEIPEKLIQELVQKELSTPHPQTF